MTTENAFDLAVRQFQAGQLPQAEEICQQILAQQSDNPDALHLLGVMASYTGRHDIAADFIKRAIGRRPESHSAWNDLGNAFQGNGERDAAIAAYRRSIGLKPDYPEPHGNLGVALSDNGQLDEAISEYRQAIALKPDNPLVYSNLGNALAGKGKVDEAIAAYRRSIALNPNSPDSHSNLGNVLMYKMDFDGAIAAYRRALTLRPNSPEAQSNLGVVMTRLGNLDEATAAYRQAIVLRPTYADAWNNLGNSLTDTGELDEAIVAYRRAIELRPGQPDAFSNLIFTMHCDPRYSPGMIVEESRRWCLQHAEPVRRLIKSHSNDRDPSRRIRIGYVSPDLRDHPVGRFLLPLLANHDHQAIEVFGYAQVAVPDSLTQRLRSHTDQWRSIVGLSDDQAADLIRQDHIDILVDLTGHTAHNRLLVFARKPAPVQVSYLGYPGSTGLSSIDYRLTDAYADPPRTPEQWHGEQLICLSPCAWCFSPTVSPPVTARQDGEIIFGSFNNFAKVTEPVLRLWGRILQAVPGSRLLLKAVGLGSEAARRRVHHVLGECRIGPERLELRGREAGYDRHLALYGSVDIALDTFPYHGTTTTCEALWMGVPVVSLPLEAHVSRVGVSLLSNAGLAELVAKTPDEYVRLAVDLANDPARLSDLRSTLRQRMEHSPLMDAPRFACNVEAAYRQMWRTWCATLP